MPLILVMIPSTKNTMQRSYSNMNSSDWFVVTYGMLNWLKRFSHLKKIDCIIHLAARAGVRPSLLEPRSYMDINITGTMNLLEAMRTHNVDQWFLLLPPLCMVVVQKVHFVKQTMLIFLQVPMLLRRNRVSCCVQTELSLWNPYHLFAIFHRIRTETTS